MMNVYPCEGSGFVKYNEVTGISEPTVCFLWTSAMVSCT